MSETKYEHNQVFRSELSNRYYFCVKVRVIPNLYAIGTVDPRGNAHDLMPPFQKFEMWQVCNRKGEFEKVLGKKVDVTASVQAIVDAALQAQKG